MGPASRGPGPFPRTRTLNQSQTATAPTATPTMNVAKNSNHVSQKKMQWNHSRAPVTTTRFAAKP